MTTKLTVLGCGGSLGVPNIMNRMGDCDPANPKNYRTRTSAWVEHNGKNFLIDTAPDLRTQLLREKLAGIRPDGVLYTHAHADHCHGIDDLRAYYWPSEERVNVYGSAEHIAELERKFDFEFFGSGTQGLYNPILKSHTIAAGRHTIAGAEITAIQMPHGDTISMGYRFGDFAWTTDFKTIPPEGLSALRGIKVWFAAVADWEKPHPSHAVLPEVLELCEKLGNPRTYLIHLNPRADYAMLDAATPAHISPAHDGLSVSAG
jgi:phosphoribosyl 1,2-cyclic phosphate phosphodiesterase